MPRRPSVLPVVADLVGHARRWQHGDLDQPAFLARVRRALTGLGPEDRARFHAANMSPGQVSRTMWLQAHAAGF